MLTAILPGLRQVRTPLVCGALYLLAIWLIVGPERFVGSSDRPLVLVRAHELAQLVGAPTVLAFAALGAYLVGTFVTIHSWPGIAVRAHAAFGNIRLFGLRKWFSGVEKPTFGWRGWRPGITGYWSGEGIQDPFEPIDPFFPLYGYLRADGLGTEMEVARSVPWAKGFDQWLHERGRRFHKRLTWSDIKVSAAGETFEGAVAHAWRESRDFMWRRANNELDARGGSWESSQTYFDLRDDQVPPWPPEGGKWPENWEHKWWDIEENADEPIHGYVLIEAYRDAFDSDFQNLLAKIRSQNSPVYEDYSRHMAEAELRYSISPPIAACVLALTVGVNPWYASLFTIPLALLRQGFHRERFARVTILDGLRNSAIESPALAALEEALRAKRQ